MKSTALKIFLAFYGLFFFGLLCVVLCTSQSDLHIALTLGYLSNFSPDWVAFQDIFFQYITELGSWVPFVVAGVLLFYKLGWSLLILLPQLLLGIVIRIIKVSAAAPRPSLYFSANFPDVALHQVDGVVLHHTNSFPSGHTATVFSLMLCLTLIFNKKSRLAPIFFVLAALAAYSRIYLSQHFAEDVLAGSLVGVLITMLVYWLYQRKPYAWEDKSVVEVFRKNKIDMQIRTLIAAITILASVFGANAQKAPNPIDREALVKRHTVTLDSLSGTELLQVGNGEIAFGIDATGLQTFYGNTMSHWGWHSVPCPVEGGHAALKLKEFDFHGRKLPYRYPTGEQKELYNWMRENPHRACLGRLRFLIKKSNGQFIEPADVKEIRQTLDMWSGIIESRYTIEGTPVRVISCADPKTGSLATEVHSALIGDGRLQVEWTFPYGHPGNTGADWNKPEAHKTVILANSGKQADLRREMDGTVYYASIAWSEPATLEETEVHRFILTPKAKAEAIKFTVCYSPEKSTANLPAFANARKASKNFWPTFWKSGGAIDLSGSRDPRWKELERRIVLSQYLLAVNEAGSLPPQESGLFNNGWNGKFHLEMHWWHGAHYGLWGRWPMMDRSLWWYRDILPKARELAQSQGFKGARWPKMIGPDGEDSPSGTGPLLIWQQPHPIFYAELEYRLNPTKTTLEKWQAVVQESAELMADFAFFDEATQHYVLGPPLATVPENSNYVQSWNPTFELSYWRTGLRWAQTWRERLGLPRVEKWDDVIRKLAPLPVQDGVYLSQENMPDSYTKMNWEHPSLIGPGGMLPGDGADPETVKRTVQKVWATWQWDRCWGWDFPMMAMAAARNGNPQMAIDALLHPSFKNAINKAGLSTGGPFPYFPTNGGILYAVALMAAGWDGAPNQPAPGFPNDGSWAVRFEGLVPAP